MPNTYRPSKEDLAKWPCRRKGYCANHPNSRALIVRK